MFELSHVMGIIAQRLGPRLVNAPTVEARDKALQNALNSPLWNHLVDKAGEEIHEKVQAAEKNPQIVDKLHISPEAQRLYQDSANQAPIRTEEIPE
jgi:hypothetical protein